MEGTSRWPFGSSWPRRSSALSRCLPGSRSLCSLWNPCCRLNEAHGALHARTQRGRPGENGLPGDVLTACYRSDRLGERGCEEASVLEGIGGLSRRGSGSDDGTLGFKEQRFKPRTVFVLPRLFLHFGEAEVGSSGEAVAAVEQDDDQARPAEVLPEQLRVERLLSCGKKRRGHEGDVVGVRYPCPE